MIIFGGRRSCTRSIHTPDKSVNAAKHRLAELPDHAMPPVLTSTAVLEKAPGTLGQAKRVVKLPIGEKSGVGSDLGTVELKLHLTVKIDP
jgi:hypothetical protein